MQAQVLEADDHPRLHAVRYDRCPPRLRSLSALSLPVLALHGLQAIRKVGVQNIEKSKILRLWTQQNLWTRKEEGKEEEKGRKEGRKGGKGERKVLGGVRDGHLCLTLSDDG